MSTISIGCRHFQLISLVAIVPVIVVLRGSVVLSNGLTSLGLLAFAKHLHAPSCVTGASTLFQAEHLLQQAVLWNPGNASAKRGLGFVWIAQGRKGEALAVWQAAVGMTEEFIQRGEQARNAERYEEALEWYARAAEVEPGLGDVWYYMGLTYEEMEQWERALRAYQRAAEADASASVGKSNSYYRIGMIYQQRMDPRQPEKALEAFEAAIAADDFLDDREAADTHYRRGAILRQLGREPAEYIAEFQKAIDMNPRHAFAHILLGTAYYVQSKDVTAAEAEIRRALEINPRNKWAYLHLGDIYRQEGQCNQASLMYRNALEIDPAFELARKRQEMPCERK